MLEAWAIRLALQNAEMEGWQKIIIQSDSQHVMNLINFCTKLTYPLRIILGDILALKNVFTFCSFSFIRREENRSVMSWLNLLLVYAIVYCGKVAFLFGL
ncbi:hypothetical protein ACH5RR_033981 [Cinchona calisaya]|uniref:RNase H type-1 domain-containing protein n=1 Tax=Cinchona calisaya TaxID=153742 RepID=A0ABD2YAF6_9GENT